MYQLIYVEYQEAVAEGDTAGDEEVTLMGTHLMEADHEGGK